MKGIGLNEKQKYQLEEAWFIYGNHGKKHTMNNHKYIQHWLVDYLDKRDWFKPTQECIDTVDKIIKG